ncbi:hypothetical protein GBA52_028331 [Prunus armeniaca]|nr:hypothetical protein GBA52_028331 [Prunus armeniaca]
MIGQGHVRDAALGKGLASTSLPDGSFFICHRQPLSRNSYRSTSRISSLHHLHGVEGYNTVRYLPWITLCLIMNAFIDPRRGWYSPTLLEELVGRVQRYGIVMFSPKM